MLRAPKKKCFFFIVHTACLSCQNFANGFNSIKSEKKKFLKEFTFVETTNRFLFRTSLTSGFEKKNRFFFIKFTVTTTVRVIIEMRASNQYNGPNE